jgi:membrane protein DedA with SNARE-associated domain
MTAAFPLAVAGTSSPLGIWAYPVVLAAAALGYLGIPFIGAAAIGFAAVLASQGKLNIVAVLVLAAIGCEIGGIAGWEIGDRWGRPLLEHPGPALEWRKKAVAKGEQVYQKWGRAAVFVTPSVVSGALKMKFRQFAVWNFLAAIVFVLSVGPGAYGVGRVSTGHHDPVSLGMLIGGIAVAVVGVVVVRRHHRRHEAHRSGASTVAEPPVRTVREDSRE